MKTLFYVPIIHTSADLGSLAKAVSQRGEADVGKELWDVHTKTVEQFWNTIVGYFERMDVSHFKIYQDGMVAEGEIGERIVHETMDKGSQNYELINALLQRGAHLMKTEDIRLLMKERDRLLWITQAKTPRRKITAYFRYLITKNHLLNQRDEFITRRIEETLQNGEKGILFIGAAHHIKPKLPRCFRIIEVKQVDKVRRYQRLLPFYQKNKTEFEKLAQYLIAPV